VEATGHSLVPLLRALQSLCQGNAGEFVHYGATTQDITDTGLALELKDVWQVVYRELRDIEDALLSLAAAHRETVMVGRTHGQPALPTTFGLKVAVWAREIRRHIERLKECRSRVLVGQLAGGVGTLAAWGDKGLEVQKRTLERLGLGIPDVVWHTARDALAEFMHLLAMAAMTCAKMGNEIYALQRPEVGELEEPFIPGRIGSSTMPHKRNPEASEHLVTISKVVRYNAAMLTEGMLQEHERDGRAWKAEWVAVPEACIAMGALLKLTKTLLQGLVVKPQAMARNLDLGKGLILSEAIMLALGEKVGKQTAHALVYQAAMRAYEEGLPLKQALLETPAIAAHLTADELDRLLDYRRYIGLAPQLVDEVVRRTREERQTDP